MTRKPNKRSAGEASHRSAARAAGGRPQQLRIIGGQWRSRRLPVADVPGLRPTPDRMRETLFNWLQQRIPAATCLDLFAGSGALGLEALSREAARVVFVEQHRTAFTTLQANIATLGAAKAELYQLDALHYLQTLAQPAEFELIFLDPPFRQGLLAVVLRQIHDRQLLKSGGMIYAECEAEQIPDFASWGLFPFREARAGQVYSALLKYHVAV